VSASEEKSRTFEAKHKGVKTTLFGDVDVFMSCDG
jgi:hypothetical protein